MTGTTTTLCVRRATYWDEEMGKEDPAKKGVCSNYLCDAEPGAKLKLTGPSGKVCRHACLLGRGWRLLCVVMEAVAAEDLVDLLCVPV